MNTTTTATEDTTIDIIPQEPVMEVQKEQNPLMGKIRLPGEIHQLPSGGIFYTNNELDSSVSNGEVQVFPMTAIDEIVLRSPDLMFSGEAIDQVIKRCVPQILKPREIFAKDIDFLLTVLRKVSYGEFFELKLTHTCKDAKEHGYSIPLDKLIKDSKKIDPVSIGNKFTATLPNGQIINFHPMRYEALVELMQSSDPEIKPEERTDQLIEVLVHLTQDVDGITDAKQIHEWYAAIPVGWSKNINGAIDNSSDWGPDFSVKVICKDCDEEFTVGAPLNPISFFF